MLQNFILKKLNNYNLKLKKSHYFPFFYCEYYFTQNLL